MKLIKSSFEILEQESGIQGIYKQIELAGRLSYKSENKITEDSANKFIDMLTKKGHTSCLEHGTVYLAIPYSIFSGISQPHFKYRDNKYSKVKNDMSIHDSTAYITTNYRVLYENNWLDDLKYLCEPTKHHEKRISVKFTLPISISREFIRHKILCVA